MINNPNETLCEQFGLHLRQPGFDHTGDLLTFRVIILSSADKWNVSGTAYTYYPCVASGRRKILLAVRGLLNQQLIRLNIFIHTTRYIFGFFRAILRFILASYTHIIIIVALYCDFHINQSRDYSISWETVLSIIIIINQA